MMRLVRVELRRLRARRLTLMVTLAAVAIAGLVVFGLASQSKPLSGSELQMQQQSFKQAQKDWTNNGAQQVKSCEKDQATQRKSDPSADLGCDQMAPTESMFGKPAPTAAQLLPDGLRSASYLLAFLAFLLGAGFVAAEFTTGAIGNWLTFEPRRVRVYGAKVIAVGVGVLPLALVVTATIAAGAWTIAEVWGSVALTGAERGYLLWSGVRVVVLAVVAASIGAAIGALLRHTAAVIGVAMAYIILVEGIFRAQLQSYQSWMVTTNIDAWIKHGTTYSVDRCHQESTQGYVCSSIERHVSMTHGTTYLAVVSIALVLVAGLLFNRRDIT